MTAGASKQEPASRARRPARLFAPIARFGFAISAQIERRRFLLLPGAAELAIARIAEYQHDFESAVGRKLATLGWHIVARGQEDRLSGFEVDRRLGAVLDFTECLVTSPDDGSEYLLRFCVTVCNATVENSDDVVNAVPFNVMMWLDEDADGPQHSKIWVRFSCIRHGGTPSHRMTAVQMRAFFERAKDMAAKIKAAVLSPYRDAVRAIVRPQLGSAALSPIRMRTMFTIDSFTVSTDDPAFPDAYQRIIGNRGDRQERKLPALRTLELIGTQFSAELDDILPVDDLSFIRGLYWLDITNKNARLVGVANDSMYARRAGPIATNDVQSLKAAPSNVIGILSGTLLASAI